MAFSAQNGQPFTGQLDDTKIATWCCCGCHHTTNERFPYVLHRNQIFSKLNQLSKPETKQESAETSGDTGSRWINFSALEIQNAFQ